MENKIESKESNYKELARNIMKKGLNKGFNWPAISGKIAIELGDDDFAKKALAKCLKDGRLIRQAGEIAYGLGDIETAKETVRQLIKEGDFYIAAKQAIKYQDFKTAKEIMETCFLEENYKIDGVKCMDRGMEDITVHKIAIAISENDPEFAKIVMEKCFKRKLNYQAGQIALALQDQESAQKAMQFCLSQGNLGGAGEIAVTLGDNEIAEKTIKDSLNKKDADWLDLQNAAEIAVISGDYKTAKEIVRKAIKEGKPFGFDQIVIPIIDREPQFAREIMEFLRNKGVREFANIAIALNDPEAVKEALSMALSKNMRGTIEKLAIYLSKLS